jgi:hypothetical protein
MKNIWQSLVNSIVWKKVVKTPTKKVDYHAALRQQILGLREMNIQMSKETIWIKARLWKATARCREIELVLERVLEIRFAARRGATSLQPKMEIAFFLMLWLHPPTVKWLSTLKVSPDGKKNTSMKMIIWKLLI